MEIFCQVALTKLNGNYSLSRYFFNFFRYSNMSSYMNYVLNRSAFVSIEIAEINICYNVHFHCKYSSIL